MFYLKECLVAFKCTSLACFIVKYRSMSVIWIGLFPALLPVGGAVILSSLPLGWAPVVLVGRWPPFCPFWRGVADPG